MLIRFRLVGVWALSGVVATMLLGSAATAQVLFRSELESGVGWGVNSSGDTSATFGYDYSVDNIPEAPNSEGGDVGTSGLKLEANIVSPAAGESLTAYPIGENFTGDYRLRFDAWINFSLDNFFNNGAAGTTEFIGGGIGYDDIATDIGPGVHVLATGEGGSGSDWRVFDGGVFLSTGDMVAGTRNGLDAYYSDFLPSVAAPAGQQTIADDSVAGSPGFQWITFDIRKFNDDVFVSIEKPGGDMLPLANIQDVQTGDGNIGVTYADFFSSVSSEPQFQFGIIDNVIVDVAIPEPSSLALLIAAGLIAQQRRPRQRRPQ